MKVNYAPTILAIGFRFKSKYFGKNVCALLSREVNYLHLYIFTQKCPYLLRIREELDHNETEEKIRSKVHFN